jgi:HEAT repeat protein
MRVMTCGQVEEALVAVVTGQPAVAERELERHLAACGPCRQAAREMARIWALLGDDPESPLPALARLRLAGALARAAEPAGPAPYRPHSGASARSPRRRLHRASLVGLVLLVGISVGTAYRSIVPEAAQQQRLLELVDRGQFGDVELELDDSSGVVRVVVSMSRQLELTGTSEEEPIQNVLARLALNERTRSSTRGRAVEALGTAMPMSGRVRSALVQALLQDPNPSVRLKAAAGLFEQLEEPEVQQAFLKVLGTDPNPGLRVLAVDAVLAVPGAARRPEAVDVLRQAATEPDGERYVQIRAAEFLRGL